MRSDSFGLRLSLHLGRYLCHAGVANWMLLTAFLVCSASALCSLTCSLSRLGRSQTTCLCDYSSILVLPVFNQTSEMNFNLQVSLQGCSLVPALQSKTKCKQLHGSAIEGVLSAGLHPMLWKLGQGNSCAYAGQLAQTALGFASTCLILTCSYRLAETHWQKSMMCQWGPTTLSNMSTSGPDFGIGSVSLLEITWNSILALAESTHCPHHYNVRIGSSNDGWHDCVMMDHIVRLVRSR